MGKYEMEMIRCVWGKNIEFLPIKMLTGPNLKAVEKRRGASIEIADPDLGKKLTHAQLKALSANFPEIDPDFELPPEPKPLTDEELGDLVAQPVAVKEAIPEPVSETVEDVEPSEPIEAATEETETPAPVVKRRGRKPKAN